MSRHNGNTNPIIRGLNEFDVAPTLTDLPETG